MFLLHLDKKGMQRRPCRLFNVIFSIHFLPIRRIGRCLQNGFLIGAALYHCGDKRSESVFTKCSAFYYADGLALCNTDCFTFCNADCLALCHADGFTFCSCVFCNNLQGFLFIVFGQQHVDHLTFL